MLKPTADDVLRMLVAECEAFKRGETSAECALEQVAAWARDLLKEEPR